MDNVEFHNTNYPNGRFFFDWVRAVSFFHHLTNMNTRFLTI